MNILNILFKNRRLRKPLILLVSTLFAVLFSELLVYFQVYFFWSSEYYRVGYWIGFWTPLIDGFAVGLLAIYLLGLYEQKIEKDKRRMEESIEYASLIQQAMLPESLDDNYFNEYFVFLKQCEQVGGDFYSIVPISEDELLIIVIDGVGHGVSGAFMTMFAKAIEYQIISEIQWDVSLSSPAKILNRFNRRFRKMLKKYQASQTIIGFDGGVLYYHKQKKIIRFSGAKTPLYVVQNGRLTCYKGDRKGVGFSRTPIDYAFTEYEINVDPDMRFYLATDGIYDQEGMDGSRYGKSRLETIITTQADQSLHRQHKIIIQSLKNFQGTKAQTDDMTLLGFSLRT